MAEDTLVQTARDDALLTALADHLRLPLLQIARLSELDHVQALPRINNISTQALRLVDAYVMARSQTSLELEPVLVRSWQKWPTSWMNSRGLLIIAS